MAGPRPKREFTQGLAPGNYTATIHISAPTGNGNRQHPRYRKFQRQFHRCARAFESCAFGWTRVARGLVLCPSAASVVFIGSLVSEKPRFARGFLFWHGCADGAWHPLARQQGRPGKSGTPISLRCNMPTTMSVAVAPTKNRFDPSRPSRSCCSRDRGAPARSRATPGGPIAPATL